MTRSGVRAMVLVVVLAALLVPAGGTASAQGLQKLTLAYAVPVPGSDSTFLFAGKQLGFFSDHGIDLEINTTQGTVAATGFVVSGAADLGFGGIEAVPGYALQGVPIRVIYVYTYRPIFMLGLLKGGPIKTVADLKGKRIGVSTLGSGAVTVLQYILAEAGMSMKDVTVVPIGVGPSALAAIKKGGEVDALAFWDTMFAFLKARGVELDVVQSPKLQQAYAGLGIFALEKTLKERRALVENFLRGLTKGLAYAERNPAGATAAFGKLHPPIAKNLALEEAVYRERLKLHVLPPEAKGQFGYMDRRHFDALLDVLHTGGIIKDKPPVEKLYTTEFLKAANDVDLSKLPK